MQVVEVNKFEERARYWREVIARADQFAGSGHAFCVQEGIAKSGFYSWRHKLANKAKTNVKSLSRVPSTFTTVEVVSGLKTYPTNVNRQVIDAKWLADLILHLHRGVE